MRKLSRETIKARFREEGVTIKAWAAENGFAYPTVLDVIRGSLKCTRGKSHEIAVALGIKQQRNHFRRVG